MQLNSAQSFPKRIEPNTILQTILQYKDTYYLKILNKNFEIKNGNVASGDSFITNKNYVNYVMFKKGKNRCY